MATPEKTQALEQAFDNVMDELEKGWPFNNDNYPEIPKDKYRRKDFIIKHILLHMVSAMANIAQYPEKGDHGESGGNYSYLHNGAKKQIVNSFRLARELGITGKDLVKHLSGIE